MTVEDLIRQVTQVYAQAQGVPSTQPTAQLGTRELREFETLSSNTQNVVRGLIEDAYKRGLEDAVVDLGAARQGSGMTAEQVFTLRVDMTCVAKVDNSFKLAGEAAKLMRIRQGEYFPSPLTDLFPRVYNAKLDGPPYAYVMQHFPTPPYISLAALMFTRRDKRSVTAIQNAGGRLLSMYESTVDQNLQPNMHTIYLERIEQRLKEAATLHNHFRRLSESPLTINGTKYKPVGSYLQRIRERLSKFTPRFATFVHGDPHPGNILVNASTLEVRFIDVKEWAAGDYIWDFGKLIHYLEVTGPVEDSPAALEPKLRLTGKEPELSYKISPSPLVTKSVKQLRELVRAFAFKLGDKSWQSRLDLSLASNLLGLPPARIKKKKLKSALILFGEGMRFLRRFAEDC